MKWCKMHASVRRLHVFLEKKRSANHYNAVIAEIYDP